MPAELFALIVRHRFKRLRGFVISLLIVGACLSRAFGWSSIPVGGTTLSNAQSLDGVVQSFLVDRQVSAAAVGVKVGEVVIYDRYFGWKDEARSVSLTEPPMMRIASISKPITAAAIRKLVASGALSLGRKVFALEGNGGILTLSPFGVPDSRLKDVTIQHLLDHKGGWDRGIAGDPMFQSVWIAQQLGVPSPPGAEDIARWMMGQPLQFTPGTAEVYSNFGYVLLGLILEKLSGKPYLDFVRNTVFAPIRVPSEDISLGRSLWSDAQTREPFYDAGYSSCNVFYPVYDNQQTVKDAYGGWCLEAMAANGGVIASAGALLSFIQNYHIGGPNIGQTPAPSGNWLWIFNGSLPGTSSTAMQRISPTRRIAIVVVLNKRPNPLVSPEYAEQLASVIDQKIQSGAISLPDPNPGGGEVLSLRVYSPAHAKSHTSKASLLFKGRVTPKGRLF